LWSTTVVTGIMMAADGELVIEADVDPARFACCGCMHGEIELPICMHASHAQHTYLPDRADVDHSCAAPPRFERWCKA